MSFATERVKPVSQKIALFEIDIPIASDEFCNYRGGVWFKQLRPGPVPNDDQGNPVNYYTNSEVTVRIGSFKVNNSDYAEQGAPGNVENTESSWYFNETTQVLYVHFESSNPPGCFAGGIYYGSTLGYSTMIDPENDGYYDDVHYDAKVNKIFSLRKSKDFLQYGILRYPGGTIQLDNTDGTFDGFYSLPIYSQPARVKLGFSGLAYSEFYQVFEGLIEDFEYGPLIFNLNVQDKRKLFTTTLPPNVYSTDDYPYMDTENSGSRIPYIYGVVRECPVVCTNELETPYPTVFSFKYADTTYHDIKTLTEVRVSKEAVTPTASDLTEGTFTLTTGSLTYSGLVGTFQADERVKGDTTGTVAVVRRDTGSVLIFKYKPEGAGFSDSESITGQTSNATADIDSHVDGTFFINDEVLIDVDGFESGGTQITNGLDVIKDIILNNGGIAYGATTYNTTEWAAETSNAMDVGLFINQKVDITRIIEEICSDVNGSFDVQDNGLFTFRIYDSSRASTLTIQADEWLYPPNIRVPAQDYLSDVTIGYSKNQNAGRYKREPYTTLYDTIINKHGVEKNREILTNLTSSADAIIKGSRVMAIAGYVNPIVTNATKVQNIELNVMDFITTTIQRQDGTVMIPESLFEIIMTNKGNSENEIILKLRWVSAV